MSSRLVLRLSAEAWVILKALHRARHGGRPAPSGWYPAYAELLRHGLAEHVGYKCVITHAGEAAVRARKQCADHVGLAANPQLSIVRPRI